MPDTDNEQFGATQLETFSPFQIVSHKQYTTEATRRDGGKFQSKGEIVTIRPQGNTSALVDVKLFDRDWQTIRALLILNGGAEKTLFTATYDRSQKPARLLFTVAKKA